MKSWNNQPKWKCIANLGDRNPVEHGGVFVYIDLTGVYCPEMEIWQPSDTKDEGNVYRVLLGECSLSKTHGTLSDNQYHSDWNAWFTEEGSVKHLADFTDQSEESLKRQFVGSVIERANAWLVVFQYYGPQDSEERVLTFAQARRRYRYAANK